MNNDNYIDSLKEIPQYNDINNSLLISIKLSSGKYLTKSEMEGRSNFSKLKYHKSGLSLYNTISGAQLKNPEGILNFDYEAITFCNYEPFIPKLWGSIGKTQNTYEITMVKVDSNNTKKDLINRTAKNCVFFSVDVNLTDTTFYFIPTSIITTDQDKSRSILSSTFHMTN